MAGDPVLPRGRIHTAALGHGDLPIVSCARRGRAVRHFGARELLLDGLVDAGFAGCEATSCQHRPFFRAGGVLWAVVLLSLACVFVARAFRSRSAWIARMFRS